MPNGTVPSAGAGTVSVRGCTHALRAHSRRATATRVKWNQQFDNANAYNGRWALPAGRYMLFACCFNLGVLAALRVISIHKLLRHCARAI